MDKTKISGRCSPYLQKPLRSLDEALKDQADIIQQNNAALIERLRQPAPLVQPQTKKAS
jgi:hypothetical protein